MRVGAVLLDSKHLEDMGAGQAHRLHSPSMSPAGILPWTLDRTVGWLPAPPVGLWNCCFGMAVADLEVMGKHLVCVCVWQARSALASRSRRSLICFANIYGTRCGRAALLVPDPGACGAVLRSGWVEGLHQSMVRRCLRSILFPWGGDLARMGWMSGRETTKTVCVLG